MRGSSIHGVNAHIYRVAWRHQWRMALLKRGGGGVALAREQLALIAASR